MRKTLFIAAAGLLLFGCRPNYMPKQMGYYRIDTPLKHEYQVFDRPGYPYTFEYPSYARIEIDTQFFKEKADNPYWININYYTLGGILNLTYKPIKSAADFFKMNQETYKFTFFHHEKADFINDETFMFPDNHIYYTLYTVGGNAASRYQFTATDTTSHFLFGSLYFDVTPNADSLKPVTDFLIQDINHMIETLKFR